VGVLVVGVNGIKDIQKVILTISAQQFLQPAGSASENYANRLDIRLLFVSPFLRGKN